MAINGASTMLPLRQRLSSYAEEAIVIMLQPKCTDTWGQLVLLTTILNHKTCINTSRQVLEKTLVLRFETASM